VLLSQDWHTTHDSGSTSPSSLIVAAAPIPAGTGHQSWGMTHQDLCCMTLDVQPSTRLSLIQSCHWLWLHPQFPHGMIYPPALHTACISIPIQQGNPRLLLVQGLGSNMQPDGFSLVSLTAARTWNTGLPTNPKWDEYSCDNFNYTMKCKAAVEQECCSNTTPYPRVSLGQNSQSIFRMFKPILIPLLYPIGTVSTLMTV
jgi:hypothetical protein